LATDLTQYNWWGRTTLHLREGDERRGHLEALILGIKLELNAIEERRERLKEEKRSIEATTKLYLKMKEELRTAQQVEKTLKQSIADMHSHPVVRAGLGYHARMSAGARLDVGTVVSERRTTTPEVVQPDTFARQLPKERRSLFDDSSEDDIDDELTKEGEEEKEVGVEEEFEKEPDEDEKPEESSEGLLS